jgi:LacI family transcriptional regulator
MITLRKVAADLGLDCGTVSHILNHDDARYSVATRKRVRDYASKIGYRPNAIARAMRTRKTGIVGLLFRQEPGHPLAGELYYSRIIEGVETELLDAGYKVLLASVSNAEIASCQLPSIYQDGLVEGLIVLGTSDKAWIRSLYKACRRLVVVDEAPLGFPAVVSANFEGGRQVARYFWEHGHRSFALITGARPNPNFQERLDGFQSWISEQLDSDVTIPVFKGDAWRDGGRQAALEVLGMPLRPSAVFCVNDHMAIDAMKALQDAGYRVPEEVSVIGFDDILVSAYASPALTTIAVDKTLMGRESARMLVERLRDAGKLPASRKELSLKIVERASVSSILEKMDKENTRIPCAGNRSLHP